MRPTLQPNTHTVPRKNGVLHVAQEKKRFRKKVGVPILPDVHPHTKKFFGTHSLDVERSDVRGTERLTTL